MTITSKQLIALQSLGIKTPKDILYYYPYRYETIQEIDFKDYKINRDVVLEALIIQQPICKYYKGRNSYTNFVVENESSRFNVVIFNRPWLAKLQVNTKITIIGKYQGNNKIVASQISQTPLKDIIGIHPVYSLKNTIRESTFKKLIIDQLALLSRNENFLPKEIASKYGFLSDYEAIKEIHIPTTQLALTNALETLKYQEFFKFHLLLASRKHLDITIDERFVKNFSDSEVKKLIDGLPFPLTNDQLKAINEILQDLKANKPMTRLLQGDVGCGKTIVAFISMYATALANKQAVLMAPTEILARQHYNNLQKLLANTNIEVALLYGNNTVNETTEIRENISNGKIKLIVGTHSVFQNSINYHDLGLVITDEQQRFGVKQRQTLLTKGNFCDVLMMTATPIPRTLANSLYGDLDISSIMEMPNSHKIIHTKLIKKNSFIPVIKEIEALLKQGNQMYVVCPAISEDNSKRNVTTIYHNLKDYFSNSYKVGLLHGQQSVMEKQAMEDDFINHKIDIIVCTTVIEVGVDVKDANIIVIYNANNFGLSQLHQLRGRVARGNKEGYCYLLTDTVDEIALKKLEIIEKTTDGFEISYNDLMLRGPGDLMGYKQSGLPLFSLGNIIKDNKLLEKSRVDAIEVLKEIDNYPILQKFIDENQDNNLLYS